MDPMTIALICTAVFGTVMVIAAFIRQLLLSRDKKLNDEAQSRALNQEMLELEKIRTQMQNNNRFEIHYNMLGENKNAIRVIDLRIEERLNLKSQLVEEYARLSFNESQNIVTTGEASQERKSNCDKYREDIDYKMAFYDTEIKQLQAERKQLWDGQVNLELRLLDQEKSRNENLDDVYKQHSALLEKVYLRHIDDIEAVTLKTLEAGTVSFKEMLLMPVQFLMQIFTGTGVPNMPIVQARVERHARVDVERAEKDINELSTEKTSPAQRNNDSGSKKSASSSTSISFAI